MKMLLQIKTLELTTNYNLILLEYVCKQMTFYVIGLYRIDVTDSVDFIVLSLFLHIA